jgi:hypothetical protein
MPAGKRRRRLRPASAWGALHCWEHSAMRFATGRCQEPRDVGQLARMSLLALSLQRQDPHRRTEGGQVSTRCWQARACTSLKRSRPQAATALHCTTTGQLSDGTCALCGPVKIKRQWDTSGPQVQRKHVSGRRFIRVLITFFAPHYSTAVLVSVTQQATLVEIQVRRSQPASGVACTPLSCGRPKV